MDYSDTGKTLGETKMVVDKLHEKGHKGKFCLANCDPYKSGIGQINTVICEQKFVYTNKFKQLRCMNYLHFNLFLTYMFDLDNLRRLGRLSEINPKKDYKKTKVEDVTLALSNMKINNNNTARDIDKTSSHADLTPSQSVNVENQDDKKTSMVQCQYCVANFSTHHGLKIHVAKKHPEETNNGQFQCTYCSKRVVGKSGLKRHERSCESVPKEQLAETHKHACPRCGNLFTHKKDMNRHIRESKRCKSTKS